MAESRKAEVGSSWSKVADGACFIVNTENLPVEFLIGDDEPDIDKAYKLNGGEAIDYAYDSPVWFKVPENRPESETMVLLVTERD
jgi:hypothetical protein